MARKVTPKLYGSQVVGSDWKGAVYGDFMLYRFYDDTGRLLYIGVTCRPSERFTGHRRSSPWWPNIASIKTQRINGHRNVLAAERLAIGAERPAFNRRSKA